MTDEFIKIRGGKLVESIENEMLRIIRQGISAQEHQGLRPLREIFQNSDDEISDRVFIHIDENNIEFLNDGNCLTAVLEKGELVGGSCRHILGINMASKKHNPDSAGEFGTGLRSAHAISHFIEVHAEATEAGKKTKMEYVGKTNAYDKNLIEYSTDRFRFKVRKNDERPERTVISRHCLLENRTGIMIRLPWRKKVYPGGIEQNVRDWETYLWNKERITELYHQYVKEIPRILLGCSWIREVVLDFELDNEKKRTAWIRDFNHREFEYNEKEVIRNNVKLSKYSSHSTGLMDGLTVDIKKLKKVDSQTFTIFSYTNPEIKHLAEEARHLAPCHILMPDIPQEKMPAYTPIALTGNCGNYFAPISFLPPDETRTIIKIEGVNADRQIWAANAIKSITDKLLPELLLYSQEKFKDKPNTILQLLPRSSTDRWFSNHDKLKMPYSENRSQSMKEAWKKYDSFEKVYDNFRGFETNNMKQTWEDMNDSWEDYTIKISNSEIFPNIDGELVAADSIYLLDFNYKHKVAFRKLFQKLGLSTLNERQEKILDQFNDDDWGYYHPKNKMKKISSLLHLKDVLNDNLEKMTVNNIGKELIDEILEMIILSPDNEWKNDSNRLQIPIIPCSDGFLKSMQNEEQEYNFFSTSEKYSELMLESRRIKKNYIKILSPLLQNPSPVFLAKIIHEMVTKYPKRFSNIKKESKLFRQLSMALLEICESPTFNLESVKDFAFIPCTKGGKIFVRNTNRVEVWSESDSGVETSETLVWKVTDGFPTSTSPWQNTVHKDFIFGDIKSNRDELRLHPLIYNQITWLEIHKDEEKSLGTITEKLKIHTAAGSRKDGLNIIRSLIFALTDLGMSKAKPYSIFSKDDKGTWGLEKWIGKKLKSSEIDDALNSVLKILSDKDELKGGWGAHKNNDINELYLLKDNSGEWSKVGDLCIELTDDLQELFGKKPISQEHRDLLHSGLLSKEQANSMNNPGGLGIKKRISEQDILTKLESLDIHKKDTRKNILSMMLNSKERWDLEELENVEWIIRKDGKIVVANEVWAPTPEMKRYFGNNHPWFIDCEVDFSNDEVKSRCREIGFNIDINNVDILIEALLGPDLLWDGIKGFEIIEKLTKEWKKEKTKDFLHLKLPKRGRLPDKNGIWHDNSWVMSSEYSKTLKNIYTGKNICDEISLNGSMNKQMATCWLVDGENKSPDIQSLIEEIRLISDDIDLEDFNNNEFKELKTLWEILYSLHHQKEVLDESQVKYIDCENLLVPSNRDNKLFKLGEIIFDSGDKYFGYHNQLGIEIMDSSHMLKDLLINNFSVVDLDNISISDIKKQCNNLSNRWTVRNDNDGIIEMLWLSITVAKVNQNEILTEEIWPYVKEQEIFFTKMKNTIGTATVALVPMRDDDQETLKRLGNEGLPIFLVPENKIVKDKIYNILEAESKKIPFFDNYKNIIIEETKGENWPYIADALKNIFSAMKILELPNIPHIESFNVIKTEKPLPSKIYLENPRPGFNRVFWKNDKGLSNVVAKINLDTKMLEVTISTASQIRRDKEIVQALIEQLKPFPQQRNTITQLIENEEEYWGEIDKKISDIGQNHPRPLIEEAMYHEIKPMLHRLYGQCQICKRQTPRNRQGDIQEGVISFFRENTGHYRSKKISLNLGSVLYLCPNHAALQQRSLITIPDIDEAIIDAKKNSNKLDKIIETLVGSRGNIEFNVNVFERPDGEGEMRENKIRVEWKDEHATRFRDILTQYLEEKVRQ